MAEKGGFWCGMSTASLTYLEKTLRVSGKNMKQLIILTLFLLARLDGAESLPRPNIILLMGDDHGWEEVGYNGHPYLKTPFLDEMAASGLRLDNFYAQPVCSPTRGNVLTGRHPNRYGTFTPGCSLRPEAS